MSNSGNQRKIAVVGAGLAGLVAAYRLAESGAQVTVFEKDHQTGGRAKTTTRDGFKLNLGPHALYLGGSTFRFLSEIGLTPQGAPPEPSKPVALYGGKLHGLPVTLKNLLLTGYLSILEKIELATFLDKLPKLDVSPLMSISLADWLSRNIKGQRASQTIECFVRLSTYCNAPEQMSAGAGLAQLKLASKGVLYLDNGWETMVSALEKAIAVKFKETVKFRHEARLDTIRETETGVELALGTERLDFDTAILCIPPDEAVRLIPKLNELATLKTLVPNQIACLDVCLKRLPNPKHSFALGIDKPLYLSVHSNSAKLAPDGGAVLHAGHYFNAKNTERPSEAQLESLLDQLQPGWRSEVVFKRYLPHMVASYGTPTAANHGVSGLECPLVPECKNIYLCGDYVGSGAQLVDCSTTSALQAVAQIVNQATHRLATSTR